MKRTITKLGMGIFLTHLAATSAFAGPASDQELIDTCTRKGGTAEYLKAKRGNISSEVLICKIDRARVGANTFYKALQGRGTDAMNAFLGRNRENDDFKPMGYGSPAHMTCKNVGGTIRTYESKETGDQTGMCQFEDDSFIAQWTLHQGPKLHQTLYDLVRNF